MSIFDISCELSLTWKWSRRIERDFIIAKAMLCMLPQIKYFIENCSEEILFLLIKFKLGSDVHIYHPFAIGNQYPPSAERQFQSKRVDKKNHLQFNSTRDVKPCAASNRSFHFGFSSIRVLMWKATAINGN